MKKFVVIAIVSSLLIGCVSIKEYKKYVNKKVPEEAGTNLSYDWLTVNFQDIDSSGSRYRQVKNFLVPAFFFWGWNSTISGQIDQTLVADYIKSGIYDAAHQLNLKRKLAGRQLIVNISGMPGEFLYQNKGHAVMLIVAYSYRSLESISPHTKSLKVEYKILEQGNVLYQTETHIYNREKPIENTWGSVEKMVGHHMDQLKRECYRMGEEIVEGLIDAS